jgi:four helix bundle protein
MAKVLVIDDDVDIGNLLQTELTDQGHQVVVAHQGEEGMAQALQICPDLIMLDVFLPDSTGYQICSQIRKNDSTRRVPIIMMTGAARFPNQQSFALERGANEYIGKPFDIHEVSQLVQHYLEKGQATPVIPQKAPDFENVAEQVMRSAQIPRTPAPVHPGGYTPSEDMAALTSFLEHTMSEKSTPVEQPVMKINFMVPPTSTPAPQAAVLTPTPEPALASEPLPVSQPVMPAGAFAPTLLSSKERFIEFGMEVYALATRLSSTHAEQYLADQLLRTGLAVGARLTESRSAENKAEFMTLIQGALKDLKEASYWLMIVRKTGVLDQLAKNDLEKDAQALTTLLTDFVNTEKKRLSR